MHIYQSLILISLKVKYKILNLIVVPLRSHHSQNVLFTELFLYYASYLLVFPYKETKG